MNYEKSLLVNWKQFIKKVIPAILAIVMFASIINTSIDVKAANKVEDFVVRMYKVCLDREADSSGKKYWCDQLKNQKDTGVSAAYGFIFSKEFQSKKCTNEQYVKYMYDAFFGRKADSEGLKYWVAKMDGGMSREEVFAGFANSEEFNKLCKSYGIKSGCYIPGYSTTQLNQVSAFVDRLYDTILKRSCDTNGIVYWTEQLCSQKQSGSQVAGGFVFSQEFKDLHLCDDHYIEVLYVAFMGREFDEAGKSYWKKQCDSGMSREEVFNGFASSNEFKGICKNYGIVSGTYAYQGAGTYRNGTCSVCGVHSSEPEKLDTSAGWYEMSGYRLYRDPVTGEQAIGFKKIGGYTYHFDDYGIMDINWVNIDGKKYYFGYDGKMRTGWADISDSHYYFNADGSLYHGFLTENGKLYHINETGYMDTKLRTIDGKKYYFDPVTGVAQKGWVKYYDLWYYFDTKTYQSKTGWLTVKDSSGVDQTYYLDLTGVMVTGDKYISGNYYRFKKSGELVKGWYQDSSTQYWYFYKRTTGVAQAKGWFKDNSKWYYSKNIYGLVAINEIVTTDKGRSIVGTDGTCKYGWIEFNNRWYYADKSTGYLYENGIYTIGTKVYFFQAGVMQKNVSYGGYHFGSDGAGTKQ